MIARGHSCHQSRDRQHLPDPSLDGKGKEGETSVSRQGCNTINSDCASLGFSTTENSCASHVNECVSHVSVGSVNPNIQQLSRVQQQLHVQQAAAAHTDHQEVSLRITSEAHPLQRDGRPDPRGAPQNAERSRRAADPQLDKNRAAAQDCRENWRGHVPQPEDQEQGPLPQSGPHQGAEQGIEQEESGSGRVLHYEVGHEWTEQSDHRPAPDGCDEAHHGDHAKVIFVSFGAYSLDLNKSLPPLALHPCLHLYGFRVLSNSDRAPLYLARA